MLARLESKIIAIAIVDQYFTTSLMKIVIPLLTISIASSYSE